MNKNRLRTVIISALVAVILLTILLFMINYSKEVERNRGIVIGATASTDTGGSNGYESIMPDDKSEYPDYNDNLRDINKVKQEDLARVTGIGRTLAYDIVRYREDIGGFSSMRQLKEVHGMTEEAYLILLENFKV